MTDDLKTLAAEAACNPPGRQGPCSDCLAAADRVLAAVLPAHRRQVLAEAGLSTTPRPLWEDSDLAALDTAEIIAWFIHWACHRRGACQCETPDDEEIDHGQRAASALRRIGRLAPAVPAGVPLAEVLDALEDEDALRAWYAARHPYACIDIGAGRFFAEYLADRFGAKDGTDG